MENNIIETFSEIENKLISCLDYVALDIRNLQTFSKKFLDLYLDIGDELESIIPIICKKNNADIKTLYKFFQKFHDCISNRKVIIADFIVRPWAFETTQDGTIKLQWWKTYQKLKHEKYNKVKCYIQEANLQNILYAFSGLYILISCINGYDKCVLEYNLSAEINQEICFLCKGAIHSRIATLYNDKNRHQYNKLYYLNKNCFIDYTQIIKLAL